ncbi:UNVERIFIED_CONTAM: hypothetical protein Slati_4192700 [Sesamum latifolium]|uniref:DUF4283 domain-containing protein n=1 Tax=Sesamum latifolium TaxID=2727402 RepID=A0AAW2TBX5_9LAMI
MEAFCHKLGQNLRLTEKDGRRVVIPDGLWTADSETHQLFLVGRFLSKKQPKFEALATSIKSMLDPVKGLEIRRLEEGRFLIRFNYIIDRNRALEGCPWSFEKNTLILSSVGVNENSMHVDLNWCEFCVHIHDLPLSKMNFGIASFIGNSLGKFRDLEMEDSGRAWGSSMRIYVALNVTQPLIRALRVCTTMGDEVVVSFTYERLRNFCYLCGHLGHIDTYRDLHFEEGFQDPRQDMPYGVWLRAPPRSWGTCKSGSLPVPSTTNHSNQSKPVRGSGVFDFGNAPDPRRATESRGKAVVHEVHRSDHSKQQGSSGDEVHSAANAQMLRTDYLAPCDEQLYTWGSYVPNTVLPAESVLPIPNALNEDFHPEDMTVGQQEIDPSSMPQEAEILMELEETLIPVLVQFAVGTRGLIANRGRGRRRGARRGKVVQKWSRDTLVVVDGQGMLRESKRHQLMDEESDVLSVEAAPQPRHSP